MKREKRDRLKTLRNVVHDIILAQIGNGRRTFHVSSFKMTSSILMDEVLSSIPELTKTSPNCYVLKKVKGEEDE